MNKQEIKERIISTVKEAIGDNIYFEQNDDKWDECNAIIDVNGVDHIAEQSAEELIKAGYINGVDFVEWLKSSRFVKPYMDDIDYCMGIDIEVLAEALQEYLKGE